MTGTYEWNPIPHRVDVTCPACRCCAEFEFAEVVRIKLKTDVPFFQASDSFEYRQFEDSLGHLWHAALFFEGLHGSPSKAIHDLPPAIPRRTGTTPDICVAAAIHTSAPYDAGTVACAQNTR